MTGQPEHYAEELQDLLDGRLAEPRRSEVAAHVETCARCRRELKALEWVKGEMSHHLGQAELPADVAARVRAALDTADRPPRRLHVPRRAWIVGALAAAALLFVFTRGHKPEPLVSMIAADFTSYNSGAAKLDMESSDPKAVEAYFVQNGVKFETRVFDLGMMQYRLAGGRVHRLGGKTSALFAYRGPGDLSLVCQMYEGRVAELPPTSDVRQHNGITFYVHRSGNLSLVFWQEGDVVCVLVGDAQQEDVVQLAFAKAVRAGRPAA